MAIATKIQIELPILSRSSEEIMEAGEQPRSLWVSKVERKLRILKEELQRKVDGFQILKIPKYIRQPTAHFTPAAWRFGLHNRENLDTTGSEDVKLAVVVLFGLDEQSKWIEFCDFVVPDPKSMLRCYGLREGLTNLIEDEIKQVLALDALFLAVCIEVYGDFRGSQGLWADEHIKLTQESVDFFFSTFNIWNDLIDSDLCKIENQIPFDLIRRVIKYIKRLTEDEDHVGSDANGGQVQEPSPEQRTQLAAKEGIMGRVVNFIKKLPKPQHKDEDHPEFADESTGQVPVPYLEKWMKSAVRVGMRHFMDVSDDFYKNPNVHLRLSESHHILEAAYMAICGNAQQTRDYSQEVYIRIPPARRLKDSGIKIVGVVGPLCTKSYNKEKKCLRLPKINIFDETVATVRNMARYEECSKDENWTMFHDYVLLMLDLVHSPEDIKILIDCGVIDNGCGHRAFEMWEDLDKGLNYRNSSKEHNEMKRDINSRCNLQRYRLWREFKQLFLSRPWLTLSTIAITLVTFATLIQSYAAIIGSNGMKPKFKS